MSQTESDMNGSLVQLYQLANADNQERVRVQFDTLRRESPELHALVSVTAHTLAAGTLLADDPIPVQWKDDPIPVLFSTAAANFRSGGPLWMIQTPWYQKALQVIVADVVKGIRKQELCQRLKQAWRRQQILLMLPGKIVKELDLPC